jgi:adenine-specific DNA-methyltransferase
LYLMYITQHTMTPPTTTSPPGTPAPPPGTPAPPSFSKLSLQLTATLTKDEKKNAGIFFTPPSCIQRIVTLLRGVSETIHTILEPSCGSGEFITALMREYPHANITGVEFHPLIYEGVSQKFSSDRVRIQHGDFLKYGNDAAGSAAPAPDLIIGNPPYFVMKKEDVAAEYYKYFDGRPNIFILFIMKSAQILRAGGVLCFVLPSSFMNSQYYDKTRKYIVRHFAILHISRCDDSNVGDAYLDTAQDTIILILRKNDAAAAGTTTTTTLGGGIGGIGGVFERSGATIFTDNLPRITSLYTGSQSLHELGFKVNIGTVVWNQCKNILTDDPTKTRLVYSPNIVNGKFVHKTYKNPEKKAFIGKPGIRTPMIVLNRGYGVGEYKFDYCLLTPDASSSSAGYLIENHLICITHNCGGDAHSLAAFHRVICSFKDPRTQEFISCYCGNSAINSTELSHMLPIYGGSGAHYDI